MMVPSMFNATEIFKDLRTMWLEQTKMSFFSTPTAPHCHHKLDQVALPLKTEKTLNVRIKHRSKFPIITCTPNETLTVHSHISSS